MHLFSHRSAANAKLGTWFFAVRNGAGQSKDRKRAVRRAFSGNARRTGRGVVVVSITRSDPGPSSVTTQSWANAKLGTRFFAVRNGAGQSKGWKRAVRNGTEPGGGTQKCTYFRTGPRPMQG